MRIPADPDPQPWWTEHSQYLYLYEKKLLIFTGVQGTSITVEDLFYNVPNRLAALRSQADEFNRIADVVTR